MLDDIGNQLHHLRAELAQHVTADRRRIAADADIQCATHPGRFARELGRVARGGPFANEITGEVRELQPPKAARTPASPR